MAENVTNELLFEQLKALHAEIGDLAERAGRIENRLAAVEGHLAVLIQRDLERNSEVDSLAQRLDRIERRLDLVDTPAE